MGITKKVFDKRMDPRIPYSGDILFTTKSGFFEGELTNYSKQKNVVIQTFNFAK